MWLSLQGTDETFVSETGLKSLVGTWKQYWPIDRVTAPLPSCKMEIVRPCVRGKEKTNERGSL